MSELRLDSEKPKSSLYTLEPPSHDTIDPTVKLIAELAAPNHRIRARAATTLGKGNQCATTGYLFTEIAD